SLAELKSCLLQLAAPCDGNRLDEFVAAEAMKLLVQHDRQVAVAGYDFQPVADFQGCSFAGDVDEAMFGGETFDEQIGAIFHDWFGNFDVQRLAPDIENGSIRCRPADDGGEDGECIAKAWNLRKIAVEGVHEDRTPGLDLRNARLHRAEM